jgi:hypothetical protein
LLTAKIPPTTWPFYRDVLGAPEELFVDSGVGARVTILDVRRATLELSTPEQVTMTVEVGRRVSPRPGRLLGRRRRRPSTPTRTAWDSLNSRLTAPADLPITLFQELT